MQSTPLSLLQLAPEGIGIDSKDHVGLAHLSAIAVIWPPMNVEPTATQLAVELQPTATSSPEFEPEGTGVDWTDHLFSFQSSAKGVEFPPESADLPTAMHRLTDGQSTPSR